MSVGKRLKKARKALGLTLDDIMDRSKIRKTYLQAIENDNFEKLPGEVYTKVYIRGYAKIVNLDPQEILSEYDNEKNKDRKIAHKEVKDKRNKKFISRSKNKKESNKNKSKEQAKDLSKIDKIFRIILGIILVLILVLLSYNLFIRGDQSQNNTTNNQVTEVTQENINNSNNNDNNTNNDVNEKNNENEIQTEVNKNSEEESDISVPDITVEESTNNDENINSEEIEQVVQEKKKELKIIANEKSWLQVIVDDEIKFQGFINENEEMTHNGNDSIRIKIGNGIAIQVEYEDKLLGPFGKRGEVIIKEFNLK